MSDIDVYFLAEASSLSGDDALAPAAPNPAANPQLADADVDMDLLAEASSGEDPAPQPPRARRLRRAQPKPKAVSFYGPPGKRTPFQHAALTAKMREARASKRYRKACSVQAASLTKQFNDIVSSGAPTRLALSLQAPRWLSDSHKRKNLGNLRVVASVVSRMAPTTKLAMAYSGVHCIKSLAAMFQCDTRSVEYNQCLVAVAFLDLQAVMAERLAQAIESSRAWFQVSVFKDPAPSASQNDLVRSACKMEATAVGESFRVRSGSCRSPPLLPKPNLIPESRSDQVLLFLMNKC